MSFRSTSYLGRATMAALSWLHKNARSCGEDCQKPRESRNPLRAIPLATRCLKSNDNESSFACLFKKLEKFEINVFEQYGRLSGFANDLYSRRNDPGSPPLAPR